MDFSNRIKEEMIEEIVRAILTDAGYRVIACGFERGAGTLMTAINTLRGILEEV